jgi:GT2 family glycosyltransferase
VSADLGVCIVNWNTREYLDACLTSLERHAGALSVQTVVVDNASSDGSAEMVRQSHPQVELIANADNRYYAAANNQGLAVLDAPQVLLLNPDIEVQSGSLQTLVDFLTEHPRAGAVAPRLRGPDGKVQPSCRTFPSPDVVWLEALGLAKAFPHHPLFGKYRMTWWDYDTVQPVDQPMASALLLRAKALEEVGDFDEEFPMFFNDVDLCRRLWAGGWQVWFTPAAEMLHVGGAATRQVRREMILESHRSFLRYYEKHYRGRLDPVTYALTVGLLRVGAWWRARGRAART